MITGLGFHLKVLGSNLKCGKNSIEREEPHKPETHSEPVTKEKQVPIAN